MSDVKHNFKVGERVIVEDLHGKQGGAWKLVKGSGEVVRLPVGVPNGFYVIRSDNGSLGYYLPTELIPLTIADVPGELCKP